VKRYRLALLPTPLHRLPRLEAALDSGPLYLKRDDLIGFGLAGNKARALEYLLGAALAEGADVLVTGGAPGSNFAGAAALAARVAGLDCEVLVSGVPPDRLPVTLELARRAGATLRFTGADRERLDELVDAHCAALAAAGRTPYAVPRGGATPVGALGFAAAARELACQFESDAELAGPLGTDAVVVLPTGSGASLAGFLAGRAAVGATWRTCGVSVSRPRELVGPHVLGLAGRCATLLGTPAPTEADLHLRDAVGPGFGRVTDEDRRNVQLALCTEGVLFDSTYGAKAITAVIELVRAGERAPLVLWHTGGMPSALKLLAVPGVTG
jgi:D-cysteine desulfhydrase